MKYRIIIVSLFILSCISMHAQEKDVEVRIYYSSADSLIVELKNRTDYPCLIICNPSKSSTIFFDIIENHKYSKLIEGEIYNKDEPLSWGIEIPSHQSYIYVYKAGDIETILSSGMYYSKKVIKNMQYLKADIGLKYIIKSSPSKRGEFKSVIDIEPYISQKSI